MRTFVDVKQQLDLTKFLDSPLGTLYFVPYSPGSPRIIVRHFDQELHASSVKTFVEIIEAAQRWIERQPELNHLIRVEQPIEVGTDFVARPHHTYHTSIDAYSDWEDPPEAPKELDQMRIAFRAALGKSNNPQDKVVEGVLSRSLLEPTGKTYFGESAIRNDEGQFIVVEPKIVQEDLIAWTAGT